MDIIGIGTDIVDLARLSAAITRGGDDFRQLVFSPAELARAERSGSRETYFGCRWAAKEAFAKALGCGIGENCRMNEVEICGTPEKISLCGRTLETFNAMGGRKIYLATAAEKHYAVATVIICK